MSKDELERSGGTNDWVAVVAAGVTVDVAVVFEVVVAVVGVAVRVGEKVMDVVLCERDVVVVVGA